MKAFRILSSITWKKLILLPKGEARQLRIIITHIRAGMALTGVQAGDLVTPMDGDGALVLQLLSMATMSSMKDTEVTTEGKPANLQAILQRVKDAWELKNASILISA